MTGGILNWRGPLEPPICSCSVRSTGNNLGLHLVSEVNGRLEGLPPLPVESDSVQGDSVRI